MVYVIVSDCPRSTVVTPPNACQAGMTLTCSTDSYPAATFQWIDNLTGTTSSGATYVLPVGQYDLTCVASLNADCTNGYYSPVAFPDTGATEGFPFGTLLNRTNANRTIQCSHRTTVTGYAISMFLSRDCLSCLSVRLSSRSLHDNNTKKPSTTTNI